MCDCVWLCVQVSVNMAPSALRIALYVPNLIGYVRMALLFACLPYAFTDPFKFIVLYGLSYALDALDGVAARHLGQCSRFGALLDMVTDRAATAALLAVNAYT
ncbi:CDP-alcohol phosphatidyltransferase family protein, partial [archaeon]